MFSRRKHPTLQFLADKSASVLAKSAVLNKAILNLVKPISECAYNPFSGANIDLGQWEKWQMRMYKA